MWVVASTGDTPRSGRAAADPPGLCGLCRRPGLPSCCRAGTGTVSSERFPSRGLRIMHLEQHSLIQVCDLSENQIPVISPAIWPPPTRGRPGGRGAAAGSGRGAPCPSRASPVGRTERAVGPWGGRRQPGKEMPQEAFLGGRAGPGELSPVSLCPTHPWMPRWGQDPESSNPRRDIPVSPHIPGCARRAQLLAGTRAGGGDGEEVTTPALPRGHPGSRDVPWPSREGRREQDPSFPAAGVAQRGAGAPSIPLPAPHSQLIKALPLF